VNAGALSQAEVVGARRMARRWQNRRGQQPIAQRQGNALDALQRETAPLPNSQQRPLPTTPYLLDDPRAHPLCIQLYPEQQWRFLLRPRRSTTRSRKVCIHRRKHRIPAKQRIAAFVDFLKHFKSSSTEAADQLEGLSLNGNGADEEYDMVDDSGDPVPNARNGNGKSKIKYLNQLQEVSNRERDEIVIDLNDVELVSGTWLSREGGALIAGSTKGLPQTRSTTTS
jgi:hypothetical protein